jgi:hypothetical protein
MNETVNPEDKSKEIPGSRHWLFQLIPPLLMLGILFATDSGSALVFIAGLFVLPVLFSIISVIVKLIFFKKRKYFLVRPLLTIVIFTFIMSLAIWTYEIALDQAVSAAELIHEECNERLVCPENPAGWNVDGTRVSRNDFGVWFKYIASYQYNAEGFDIHVYHGPDIGDNIIGGIGSAIKVVPYVEE